VFLLNLQLTAVRVIPWAKANLNYTAQALIISAGMILISLEEFLTCFSIPCFTHGNLFFPSLPLISFFVLFFFFFFFFFFGGGGVGGV
jgi:hypothetical protein